MIELVYDTVNGDQYKPYGEIAKNALKSIRIFP